MAGTDAMHERIAAHPWPRGGVEVIRANRGYTLYSRRTGGPVARLRPTGEADNVQVLWWRREAWLRRGTSGPSSGPVANSDAGRRMGCARPQFHTLLTCGRPKQSASSWFCSHTVQAPAKPKPLRSHSIASTGVSDPGA